jgi:hypothetical protein
MQGLYYEGCSSTISRLTLFLPLYQEREEEHSYHLYDHPPRQYVCWVLQPGHMDDTDLAWCRPHRAMQCGHVPFLRIAHQPGRLLGTSITVGLLRTMLEGQNGKQILVQGGGQLDP